VLDREICLLTTILEVRIGSEDFETGRSIPITPCLVAALSLRTPPQHKSSLFVGYFSFTEKKKIIRKIP